MFDDDETSESESSAWSSEDEDDSEAQDNDAAAYGADDAADSWEGDSEYGDASGEAADLFAGQYDDDGGAPDVANAMGPKDEFPWPPPKTMGWFQSGVQKAGDWLFDTISDPFGTRRREIDDRKVEDARKKYGTSPAPAPGVTPIQPGPP